MKNVNGTDVKNHWKSKPLFAVSFTVLQTIFFQKHQRKEEKARVGSPVYPAVQCTMGRRPAALEDCFAFDVDRQQMQSNSTV